MIPAQSSLEDEARVNGGGSRDPPGSHPLSDQKEVESPHLMVTYFLGFSQGKVTFSVSRATTAPPNLLYRGNLCINRTKPSSSPGWCSRV